jgi:hypothetical protein
MINTVMATEIITAAWIVYQAHGFCNRSHREIVNDGIMVGKDDAASWVPSLYTTVVENINIIGFATGVADIVLTITTEIQQQAETNRNLILQTALFKFMQDQLDDFTKGVYNDLNKEEIRPQDIKRLCYMHTIALQMVQAQKVEEMLINVTNEQLAPQGHSVKVVITVTNCRYSQEFGVHNHVGVTADGYLVSFFNKTRHEFNDKIELTGKVKTFGPSFKHQGLKENRLNYTKIINVIKG